jgi:hypothetical protein
MTLPGLAGRAEARSVPKCARLGIPEKRSNPSMDAAERSLTPRQLVKRANESIVYLLGWLQETPRRLKKVKRPKELTGTDEITKWRQAYIWVVARAQDLLTTGNIIEEFGKVKRSWHSVALAIYLSYSDQLIGWSEGKCKKPSDPLADKVAEQRLLEGVNAEYAAAMSRLPALHTTSERTPSSSLNGPATEQIYLAEGESNILDALRKATEPLLAREIATKSGISHDRVRQYLRPNATLRSRGWVRKVKTGYIIS